VPGAAQPKPNVRKTLDTTPVFIFSGEEYGTRISHEAEYAPFGMAGKPVSAALFKLILKELGKDIARTADNINRLLQQNRPVTTCCGAVAGGHFRSIADMAEVTAGSTRSRMTKADVGVFTPNVPALTPRHRCQGKIKAGLITT
jgi:hypothetical protein